jgi:hypothetical protein
LGAQQRGIRLPDDDEEPTTSDFHSLGQRQCIVDVHAEIPHRVFNLCMTQQNLDRAKIAGGLVGDGGFGPT